MHCDVCIEGSMFHALVVSASEDPVRHDSRWNTPRWPSSAIGKSIDHIVAKDRDYLPSPATRICSLRDAGVIIGCSEELIGKEIATVDSDPKSESWSAHDRGRTSGDDFQLLPRENARGRGSRLLLTAPDAPPCSNVK